MLRGHSESSTQSYFETKSMQLLKVAMLISLTESFEKIITIEHFERALDLLAETEKYLARVFEGTGRNLSANMAARIMTLLEAAGTPVAKKKIARDVWAMCADGRSAEQEINEVLRSLASADKLIAKRQEVTNADGLKIVTEYLGTPEAWTAFDASVRAVSKPVEEPQL